MMACLHKPMLQENPIRMHLGKNNCVWKKNNQDHNLKAYNNCRFRSGVTINMKMIKNGFKYILVFIVAVILLTGILVLAALIPQSAIRQNVQESAEYLCEGELFGRVIEDAKGSEIDRYADSILLAIAYQYDSSHPLRSVMWSSYYYTAYRNENENLLYAVTEKEEPNQQYLRYWHGSNSIVRPLLLCFSIKEIYWLNGIVLAALSLLLLAILIKNKAYVPAIGVLAGLILTASWFVPLSLEYTWTYLLMLLMSIVGVKLALREREKYMGVLFLIGGIVTNYMDFLTTETLTLTVPLLLVTWIYIQKKTDVSGKQMIKNMGKAVLAWGIGYVGMWIMKWLLASIVLQENVMPYVSEHIGERLGGDIGIGTFQYISGAPLQNLSCLFPFGYGVPGAFAGMFLLLMALYIGYVYHKKQICKWHILLYMIPGLLPYARYLVLHNHSYLHCFFTYRAQFATILAIVLILEEIVDRRWFADAGK